MFLGIVTKFSYVSRKMTKQRFHMFLGIVKWF